MPKISALPSHSGAPPSASQLVVFDPTEALDDDKVKQIPANTFALTSALTTLEGEHDALRSEFDTLESEHDALRVEFDALEVEHDALATSMAPVNTQIADLMTAAAFFRQELLKVMTPEQTDTLLTSSTIKDVFIYDTTKDSDGGAWRTRCQSLSWYNEPLNTATRGGTREFPAVALVVAEDDTVTIYDATTAGCPMWMVFLQDGSSGAIDEDLFMLGGDVYNDYTSVNALDGVLVVGAADGGSILGVKGLYRVSFLTDSCKLYYITNSFGGDFVGTISQRNTPIGFLSNLTTFIVNRNIYDVAMTVLDAAPIDPDTLLPVPTIAVATAGGVSVIDGPAGIGTVVDGAITSAPMGKVSFQDSGTLVTSRLSGGVNIYVSPVYSADGFNMASKLYSGATIPAISNATVTCQKGSLTDIIDSGSTLGLARIKEDLVNHTNGMVSWITKDYNTGWMKGDIRRAFICDAFGLIKDSYFQNPSAWSGTGWVVESGGAKHTAGGGYTTALSPNPQIYPDPDEPYYTLVFTISGRTAGSVTVLVNGAISTAYTSNATISFGFSGAAPVVYGLEFQPTADFDGIISNVFWVKSDVLTDVDVDTITDRSVKASSLTVVGSLTRGPVATGAELQCISFSVSNFYLSQSYSADLDFGTGDFNIAVWFRFDTTLDTYAYFLHRGVPGTSTPYSYNMGFLSGTGTFEFRCGVGTPGTAVIPAGFFQPGIWYFVVGQRRGTDLLLYVNGVPAGTPGSNAVTTDLIDAELFIGIRSDLGGDIDNGKLALLRIGAGSLTDAQIFEIYRTELPLFQVGAKCTIQGTSNAVAALDYDERYNHLAVGTADGVTIFRDLEVDGYNDAGDMVAVGAKNGALLLGNDTDATWNNGDAITVITE